MMEDRDDDTDFRKRMLKGFCIDTDPEIADQEDHEAYLDMADDSDDSDVTAESADAEEGGIPDGTDLRSTMLKSCHSNPIIELFESLIIDETARREKDEITDPRTFMLRPKPLTEEEDEAPESLIQKIPLRSKMKPMEERRLDFGSMMPKPKLV